MERSQWSAVAAQGATTVDNGGGRWGVVQLYCHDGCGGGAEASVLEWRSRIDFDTQLGPFEHDVSIRTVIQ